MPLHLPTLDDRGFEQLLAEAKRRIPVHTPEWTNYEGESDPGITLVELFAFLTDNLLYRANRIPERNRLKFLQLLGLPLQPAAAARGIVTITNERGPVEALPLEQGVVVTAGGTRFLTRDGVTVLPTEAQVYYKRRVPQDDPRYAELLARYEAVAVAQLAAEAEDEPTDMLPTIELAFYETTQLSASAPGAAPSAVDLALDTVDRAVYIALLAPKNVAPSDARLALGNEVLSIGVAPARDDTIAPALPQPQGQPPTPRASLVYEIADVAASGSDAAYTRLTLVQSPDVLNEVGVVQLQLPAASRLQTWVFDDPLDDGLNGFPPRIEDRLVRERIITWLRLRLPPEPSSAAPVNARLSWVGINAARITQAVPVFGEVLGSGSGEPDQSFALANTPVLTDSVRVLVETNSGAALWRLTDDLLAAGPDDPVFTLDPEAGRISFGNGLTGLRPPAGSRVRASYEYGGGVQGNVAAGTIKASPDTRLQGGYKIDNPLATWGGDLGETVAEAEQTIPLTLRHRDRLVTERDFKDVTARTPGVDIGRVEVLPLFQPTQPEASTPGTVTVLVIPRFDPQRPRWPTPDRLFLQTVCDYLAPRRLVTTELYVRGPIYRRVFVTVGVQVRAGHFPDVVKRDVKARLYEYLSALPPGGSDGAGWPLSKRLLRKDLEAVVTRVSGVEYVRGLRMGVESSLEREEFAFGGLELPLLIEPGVVDGEPETLDAVMPGGSAAADAPPKVVPVPVIRSKC